MRLAGDIRLRASLSFWGLLVTLHGAALAVVFYPGVDPRLLWGGIPLVLVSAVWAWRQQRRTPRIRLTLFDDGAAAVTDGDGVSRPIVFHRSTRDGGWFLALCWQELASGQRRRVWLVGSAMPPEEWRLLRAWLRWRAFSRARTSSEANRSASADS